MFNSDKGNLVPDNVMVGLISSELKKLGEKPWLLDGFPRSVRENIFFYSNLFMIKS